MTVWVLRIAGTHRALGGSVNPTRLVVDRTVIAEFSREVPRSLLTVFTPELFAGCDARGLAGRRAEGRELLIRLDAAGWSEKRAIAALGDQIELAQEAYATLPESVRRRLGWPADATSMGLDAREWVRRFATANPTTGGWLVTMAGGTHPGLLLRACLTARPRARATLWLREASKIGTVPRRGPLEVASARQALVFLQQPAQSAQQSGEQS